MNVDERIAQCSKDIELLQKELKELELKKKEGNIPKLIDTGQVYEVCGAKRMVAFVGRGKCGLTVVGRGDSGCWQSSINCGVENMQDLREDLIRCNAKYLGKFNEVFQLKS